jgi:hypothetical protein
VERRGRQNCHRPSEPGGRSGLALRRKRFASTEKSSELANEISGFQAQSISGHSTTTGPYNPSHKCLESPSLILTVSLLWFNFRIARDSRATR